MGNWDLDLDFGEEFENQALDMLRSVGEKIEVKTERDWWFSTGNLCFEIKYNGEPSGLLTTEADWWFHVLSNGSKIAAIFVFPVQSLRPAVLSMVKDGTAKVKKGGDRMASEVALVPINKVYQLSVLGVNANARAARR